MGVLYWITGLPGVGKTTIGNALCAALRKKNDNVVLLDGDILKGIIDDNGMSMEERKIRAYKYAKLCNYLVNQGVIVICCTISWFSEVREWNRKNNISYVEILVEAPKEILVKRDYKNLLSRFEMGEVLNVPGKDIPLEIPQSPDIILNNDENTSISDLVEKIISFQVLKSNDFNRDTKYWNEYYSKMNEMEAPSLFAEFALKKMSIGKRVLELGCGNGRDSIFFAKNGMNVVGIDASDVAIENLNNLYVSNISGLRFVCGDFVCMDNFYAEEFDYCYSRFSLHAINDDQQEKMIHNVYNTLRRGGELFIEVRSVNDDIFGQGECVGRNAYIFNGHYRRFIVFSELVEELRQQKFIVEYAEEKKGFAPYKDSDPYIIRIVCRKE